jgi:hypothetical protein
MARLCVTRQVGSYDWANQSEKQAQWIIHIPEGHPVAKISETVEIDSEYDLQGETDPWEIADAIKRWLTERIWISTSKKKQLESIEWFFENESTLRPIWLTGQIEKMNVKISKLMLERDGLLEESKELEEEENAL